MNLQITFVGKRLPINQGPGRATYELARRLSERHSIHIISTSLAAETQQFVKWHPVPLSPLPGALAWMDELIRTTLSVRREGRGIVVSRGLYCLNCDVLYVNGCPYERPLPKHMQAGLRYKYALGRIFFRIQRGLERYICRRLQGRVLALSSGLRDAICRDYGLPDVRVVPNGVNAKEFHIASQSERSRLRTEFGIPDDAFVVSFVGGNWYRKGLDHLLRAMDYLQKSNVYLLIAGPDDQRDLIEAELQAPLVRERVVFAGIVENPSDIYSASDAFAFPTYSEAFGQVAFEAAASGLPVLASPENAMVDLIIPGQTGYFIDYDARDIAEKIQLLAGNPEQAKTIGLNARRRAEQFTWDAAAHQLEEALVEIAEKLGKLV